SALPQSSRQPGDVFDRCLLVEPHGHPVDFEHQPITSLWPGLDHPHGYQRSTRRGAGARATLRPQFVDPVRQGRPSHAQFLRALRARLATRLRLLDGPFPELSASLFALHGPQHAQVEIGFARRPWSDGYLAGWIQSWGMANRTSQTAPRTARRRAKALTPGSARTTTPVELRRRSRHVGRLLRNL